MNEIEIFEHTADIGIRLARPTLNLLFRDAAFGMFHIIAPGNEFRPLIRKDIVVEADDREQLLVAWLSELNFLFQTELFIPAEIKVDVAGIEVRAVAMGETVDRGRHNVEIEIKAVTFHKIYVVQKSGQWQARVIFDI